VAGSTCLLDAKQFFLEETAKKRGKTPTLLKVSNSIFNISGCLAVARFSNYAGFGWDIKFVFLPSACTKSNVSLVVLCRKKKSSKKDTI